MTASARGDRGYRHDRRGYSRRITRSAVEQAMFTDPARGYVLTDLFYDYDAARLTIAVAPWSDPAAAKRFVFNDVSQFTIQRLDPSAPFPYDIISIRSWPMATPKRFRYDLDAVEGRYLFVAAWPVPEA